MHTERQHLVRKASRHFEKHLAEDVSMQDVAATCGVTLRTLQFAFQEVMNTSPKAWLTTLRLRQARQALLRGRQEGTVTSAAFASGFEHMGRFSKLYRHEFGEAPSQTLRQATELAHLAGMGRTSKTARRTPKQVSGNVGHPVSGADKVRVLASGMKLISRASDDPGHWHQLHELLHDRLRYRRAAIIVKRRSDGRPFIFSHCQNGMGHDAFRLDMRRVNSVLESSRCVVNSVLNGGSNQMVGDVWQATEYAALDPDIRAELCVPVFYKGKVIGAINVESERRNPFDAQDLGLITDLGAAAAEQLNAARMNGSLGLTDRV